MDLSGGGELGWSRGQREGKEKKGWKRRKSRRASKTALKAHICGIPRCLRLRRGNHVFAYGMRQIRASGPKKVRIGRDKDAIWFLAIAHPVLYT